MPCYRECLGLWNIFTGRTFKSVTACILGENDRTTEGTAVSEPGRYFVVDGREPHGVSCSSGVAMRAATHMMLVFKPDTLYLDRAKWTQALARERDHFKRELYATTILLSCVTQLGLPKYTRIKIGHYPSVSLYIDKVPVRKFVTGMGRAALYIPDFPNDRFHAILLTKDVGQAFSVYALQIEGSERSAIADVSFFTFLSKSLPMDDIKTDIVGYHFKLAALVRLRYLRSPIPEKSMKRDLTQLLKCVMGKKVKLAEIQVNSGDLWEQAYMYE